ncbi:THO complex subunit 1-like [Mercenaria mercenaria]|uniref:THO complex subunit 1-like n=1 Tax=Mercenaria mercenaria TaxID=6596 RepID=UPI00234E48BD|nr:THO complex subunit 1-like [Mercenaria mercenaria]
MFELEKALQSAIDKTEVDTKESVTEDHSTQMKHRHEPEDLDTVPSDIDLDRIARTIGFSWELLGPHLGLSKPTIEHIVMDNNTSSERIYQMLYNWREEQGTNGTIGNLFTAFRNQPSTNIDWKTLEQSFPDAEKFKPKKENIDHRSQAEQDYEERKKRKLQCYLYYFSYLIQVYIV